MISVSECCTGGPLLMGCGRGHVDFFGIVCRPGWQLTSITRHAIHNNEQ